MEFSHAPELTPKLVSLNIFGKVSWSNETGLEAHKKSMSKTSIIKENSLMDLLLAG
ncbi:hypothetical protein N9F34_05225 [Alphaproteobacteria bacterium]|nr:hypothetical protein [Alphaproteobacteria bacterium]